jgi:hypothetical protein
MKAYNRISLPVNKLNVSSPEGDDNKYLHGLTKQHRKGFIDS